jgi:hypothetical protein
MERRAPSRESRHGQIETSPKEVDGTDFPEETAAEKREDAIDLNERAPEAVRCRRVIGGMQTIL